MTAFYLKTTKVMRDPKEVLRGEKGVPNPVGEVRKAYIMKQQDAKTASNVVILYNYLEHRTFLCFV